MPKQPRLFVGRFLSLVDSIRASYWFLPMLMAVGAGIAALVLVDLDRGLSSSAIERIPWIAKTEPEGTRGVLSVIAGSMITVTGVVFSVTIVALTLASSQFGPRLLRNFLRDRANQLAFGTFVGTFLYSLIVLRSVRTEAVPLVASAVGVLLAAASVFVLVYFIHHIAVSLQATSVIASVAQEVDAQIPHLFPDALGSGRHRGTENAPSDLLAELERDGCDVLAAADGYIRVLDEQALFTLCTRHDIRVVLHHRPGDFVYAGTALARAGPNDRVNASLTRQLRRAYVIGPHRTAVQDLRFLTSQLTEIAVRALSPGINNPHMAIDCVQRLGAVVCKAAMRDMPSPGRYDDAGALRVLAPATTFTEIVGSCFDPLRRYGAAHPAVVLAVMDTLRRVSECCNDGDRLAIVAGHARRMADAFAASPGARSARDRELVDTALDQTLQRLGAPLRGNTLGSP